MPAWEVVVLVLGALVLVAAALLVLLAVRRRWLTQRGGTFECSVRLKTAIPSAGWVLGLARYSEDALEWFRLFSYATAPGRTFRRGQVQVLGSRNPDPVEAVALYHGQLVVTLAEPGGGREWDLAMSAESLTGLMSWLEAAPPGAPELP